MFIKVCSQSFFQLKIREMLLVEGSREQIFSF